MSRLERRIISLAVALTLGVTAACSRAGTPDTAPHATPPAPHATPPVATPGTGYDVSHPQCSMRASQYPRGQAFAIVGVNGGTPTKANPCLATQLTWARTSTPAAGSSLPPVGLYLVAADPGDGVPGWPSPEKDTAGGATPHGACDGSWTEACAYLYGVQRARYAYELADDASTTGVDPARVPWWLDVELGVSWSPDHALNVAAIRGFVAGLERAGAEGDIGFYSIPGDWLTITGLTSATAPDDVRSAPEWIGGAGSIDDARARCATSFAGGPVTFAQFRDGALDANHFCGLPWGPGVARSAQS